MESVRVGRWTVSAPGAPGNAATHLPPQVYQVEARTPAVPDVVGLVAVAGDFVLDETTFGETLFSLLHGTACPAAGRAERNRAEAKARE